METGQNYVDGESVTEQIVSLVPFVVHEEDYFELDELNYSKSEVEK